MDIETIKTASAAAVDARIAEIKKNVDNIEDVEALEKEYDALVARRSELAQEEEARTSLKAKILANPGAVVVESFDTVNPKEKKSFGIDSKEYEVAFLKNLRNETLTDAEQKALATGITGNTSGQATNISGKHIAVPVTIANAIWNLVEEQHPILGDITTYRTGTVFQMIQHTEGSGATIVAEGSAPEEESNTFTQLTLAGKDFAKWIDLTYAMERMSIPALFDYLVNEVGGALGNEMAKDVVDTIKASIAAGNRESYTGTVSYADICAAFGDIERASTVTVYMKRHTLFTQVIAMTGEDGHPVFQQPPTADAAGVILGTQVKFEDAVGDGEILIGDSKKVVNNVVQDVMIETDKDIKKHVTTISGYARAEAGLADTKAFAIIAPSA